MSPKSGFSLTALINHSFAFFIFRSNQKRRATARTICRGLEFKIAFATIQSTKNANSKNPLQLKTLQKEPKNGSYNEIHHRLKMAYMSIIVTIFETINAFGLPSGPWCHENTLRPQDARLRTCLKRTSE